SRRRHTRFSRDWSSDVCSSDLNADAIQWDEIPIKQPISNKRLGDSFKMRSRICFPCDGGRLAGKATGVEYKNLSALTQSPWKSFSSDRSHPRRSNSNSSAKRSKALQRPFPDNLEYDDLTPAACFTTPTFNLSEKASSPGVIEILSPKPIILSPKSHAVYPLDQASHQSFPQEKL